MATLAEALLRGVVTQPRGHPERRVRLHHGVDLAAHVRVETGGRGAPQRPVVPHVAYVTEQPTDGPADRATERSADGTTNAEAATAVGACAADDGPSVGSPTHDGREVEGAAAEDLPEGTGGVEDVEEHVLDEVRQHLDHVQRRT